jgi:hypothetical protein
MKVLLRYKKRMWSTVISINEPETWKYSLVRANGRKLEHYIHLALKTQQQNQTFIVFDQGSMREVLVL